MITPSATSADSQYATVIDELRALFKGSDVDVISAVSEQANKSMASWPAKGSKSYLVLYEAAEDAVARGLLEGELPSMVLTKWVSDAEVWLSKHRKRRRQLTFVSISRVLTEPENFLTALSHRFEGQDFPHDWLKPQRPAWFAWQGLLARQIVSSEADAMRLSDALEAAALPLAACNYDADVVASELKALQSGYEQLSAQLEKAQARADTELAQVKAHQSDLETERALLRDQIAHLQQAIQEDSYTATERQREFSAMKLTLTAAQDRIEGLEAALNGLSTQTAKDKSNIDTLQNYIKGLEETLQGLSTQATNYQADIDAFQNHVMGLETALKGLTTQAANDKTTIDALVAQKQKLLEAFNQLMIKILHGKELKSWPWRSRRAQQIRIVRDCGVVDPDWYLQFHQDVAKAGAEPFRHYIDYGVKEGRPPNANFE